MCTCDRKQCSIYALKWLRKSKEFFISCSCQLHIHFNSGNPYKLLVNYGMPQNKTKSNPHKVKVSKWNPWQNTRFWLRAKESVARFGVFWGVFYFFWMRKECYRLVRLFYSSCSTTCVLLFIYFASLSEDSDNHFARWAWQTIKQKGEEWFPAAKSTLCSCKPCVSRRAQ